MNITKKQFSSLYLLKAFSAIMVIFIHTYREGVIREILEPVLRIAVPCFLIISGYFLVSKEGFLSKEKLKRTIIKILKIYVVAETIYIVAGLYRGHTFNTDIWGIIFYGDPIVIPFGWNLWYLVAYMEVLIIFLILPQKAVKVSFYLIPVLIIMNLLTARYNLVLGEYALPRIPRGFLFTSLPCFAVGMYIKTHEERLLSIFQKYKFIIPFIALSLIYIEYYLLKIYLPGGGEMFLFTVPLAASVFLLCLTKTDFGYGTFMEKIGRDYSLNIYVYHYLFYMFFDILGKKFGYNLDGLILFVLTCVSSLIFAVVIFRLQKRFKFVRR